MVTETKIFLNKQVVRTMEIPREWSKEVSDAYTPVLVLGRGAFASVVLGKDKKTKERVAIKVVGSRPDADKDEKAKALKYAHREISILQQLEHPNIMKV